MAWTISPVLLKSAQPVLEASSSLSKSRPAHFGAFLLPGYTEHAYRAWAIPD